MYGELALENRAGSCHRSVLCAIIACALAFVHAVPTIGCVAVAVTTARAFQITHQA